MPWQSKQQEKWGHTPTGLKALGGKDKVAEWDDATPKGSLRNAAAKAKKPVQPSSKGLLFGKRVPQ